MRFRLLIGLVSCCTILFVLSGCGPRGERFEGAPVILVTIDTLRSDHLPAYGYDGVKTPHLDALAQQSVLFEQAFAHYPLTLPSHASLMTGTWPPQHGVRDNLGFRLDPKHVTLAGTLKQEGYRTGAVVSSMVLRKTTGIDSGFDFFDDQLKRGTRRGIVNYAERRGDQSLAIAQEWLEGQPDSRFFLWLHLYDPHIPYLPPEEFRGKGDTEYDDEIGYSDHLLGELFGFLKEKGLYDPAIVIVTSDHGEGLGDHGELQHGLLLYREALQVPMIVKLPQAKLGNTRDKRLVGLSDLAPTVCSLLGLDPIGDGTSLFSGDFDEDRIIYSESFNAQLNLGWVPQQSAIQNNHHYIQGAGRQLFDLQADFAEKNDLMGQIPVPEQMEKLITRIGPEVGTQETLSQEEMELLNSLGYSGGSGTDRAEKSLDEEAFLVLFNLVGECNVLLNQEEYARVEQLLTPVVARFPDMLDARLALGSALNKLGKLEAAESLYVTTLSLAPENLSALVALVEVELGLGKRPQAERLINNVLKSAPKLGPRLLLPVLNRYNLFPMTEEIAKKALALEPNFAFAHVMLAKGAIVRGQFAAADPHLERAKDGLEEAQDPLLTALIQFTYGDRAARQNQLPEAVAFFQKAITAYPDHETSRTSLSLLYFSTNQEALARANLEDWLKQFPKPYNYEKAGKLCEIVGLTSLAKKYLEQARKP